MAADSLAALADPTLSRRMAARRHHYRMQLQGDACPDNPDQRIAEDVKLFVDRTLDIGLSLLNAV